MNTHKHARRFIASVAAALVLAAIPAAAEVEVSYDLGLYSKYVWRGLTLTDGPVLQPALTTSHSGGFSVNVWGNLELDDVNDLKGEFSELDLTLAYSFDLGKAAVDVGYIQYTFPNTPFVGTGELFVAAGFDVVLSPSITVYYDIDEVEDFYAVLAIGHGFGLSDSLALQIAASAAYAGSDFAAAYAGGTSSGFFDGNVSTALEYSKDNLVLGVSLTYTDALESSALPIQDGTLWGGVSLSMSF